MNNWIIVFICWVVFSVVIYLVSKLGEIYIDSDWWFVVLTFPITALIALIVLPIALIVKGYQKIKTKKFKKFLKKRLTDKEKCDIMYPRIK